MFNKDEGHFSFEEYAKMEGIELQGTESESAIIKVVTTIATITRAYFEGLVNAGMPEKLAMELTLKHCTSLQEAVNIAEREVQI